MCDLYHEVCLSCRDISHVQFSYFTINLTKCFHQCKFIPTFIMMLNSLSLIFHNLLDLFWIGHFCNMQYGSNVTFLRITRLIAKYRPTMPVLSVVIPRLTTNQLRWSFTGAFQVREYATVFPISRI